MPGIVILSEIVIIFQGMTDSTIHSTPKKQRLSLTNVLWLLDTRTDGMKIKSSYFLLVCKGLSNDDVGGSKGRRIPGDTAGSWFRNRRFR